MLQPKPQAWSAHLPEFMRLLPEVGVSLRRPTDVAGHEFGMLLAWSRLAAALFRRTTAH
jgi:hypothetical protein